MPKKKSFEYPVGLYELNDQELGKVCRALGKAAANFREQERCRLSPDEKVQRAIDLVPVNPAQLRSSSMRDRETFWADMKKLDSYLGKCILDTIQSADRTPGSLSMHSKQILFRPLNGMPGKQPVLYTDYWHTDDLDDISRDTTEIQFFVGLHGYLDTEPGKELAGEVLGLMLYDGWESKVISRINIPTPRQTFGSVESNIFEPFVKD